MLRGAAVPPGRPAAGVLLRSIPDLLFCSLWPTPGSQDLPARSVFNLDQGTLSLDGNVKAEMVE